MFESLAEAWYMVTIISVLLQHPLFSTEILHQSMAISFCCNYREKYWRAIKYSKWFWYHLPSIRRQMPWTGSPLNTNFLTCVNLLNYVCWIHLLTSDLLVTVFWVSSESLPVITYCMKMLTITEKTNDKFRIRIQGLYVLFPSVT